MSDAAICLQTPIAAAIELEQPWEVADSGSDMMSNILNVRRHQATFNACAILLSLHLSFCTLPIDRLIIGVVISTFSTHQELDI